MDSGPGCPVGGGFCGSGVPAPLPEGPYRDMDGEPATVPSRTGIHSVRRADARKVRNVFSGATGFDIFFAMSVL